MTNLQLLLSIGIPSVLIMLAWFSNGQRIGRVEAQNDRMDSKIDALRRDFHVDMTSFRDTIHRDMVELHERTARVENA